MRETVIAITKFQKIIDVEHIHFLGLGLDRYLHFSLCFFFVLLMAKFKKLQAGIVLMSVLIIFKEVFDLGVILYFSPIAWASLYDSIIDILVGFTGVIAAYYLSKKILKLA